MEHERDEGPLPQVRALQHTKATYDELGASLEYAQQRLARLEDRLLDASTRLEVLEGEPEVPQGSKEAPSWVVGRLRRAVARCQVVFERLAVLDDAIERYEDALMLCRGTLNKLRMVDEGYGAIDERLSLVSTAQETLAELLEASVEVEQMRELASLAAAAELEMDLALEQTESSTLKLGLKLR